MFARDDHGNLAAKRNHFRDGFGPPAADFRDDGVLLEVRCLRHEVAVPACGWAVPVERPFLPEIEVTHQQDPDVEEHLHEAKPPQRPEDKGPGIQEDGFHIEQNKYHGDQIELHGKRFARIARRRDAALIGLRFYFGGASPAHQRGKRKSRMPESAIARMRCKSSGAYAWRSFPVIGAQAIIAMKRQAVKCTRKIDRHILLIRLRIEGLRRSHSRKGWRSMNFGFNSNVRVGDVMYHVQTEDRGPSHPFLDTVVYHGGPGGLQAQHELREVCPRDGSRKPWRRSCTNAWRSNIAK